MRQLYEELLEELENTGQWRESPLGQLSILNGMIDMLLPSEDITYQVVQKDMESLSARLRMERLVLLGVEVSGTEAELCLPKTEEDAYRVTVLLNTNPAIDFIENIIPCIKIKETQYVIEACDSRYPYVLQASCEAELGKSEAGNIWKLKLDKIQGEPQFTVRLMEAGVKKGFTLDELFTLTNLSEWQSHLPDVILEVLETVYLEELGIIYDGQNKQLIGMELTVGWDGRWEIFGGFSVSDIQVRLKSRNLISLTNIHSPTTKYEAVISGKFTLGKAELPVALSYNEMEESLGIKIAGQEKTELTDLNMLSPMIGEIDLSALLPSEISEFHLYLEELNFTYGYKEKKTQRFTLGVDLQTNWKLFGSLELERLRLYYDKGLEGGRALLEGILQIGDGNLRVSVEKEHTRYIMSGKAEKPLVLSFTRLARAAGLELPAEGMELAVKITSVMAWWGTEEKNFYLEWKESGGKVFCHKDKDGIAIGMGYFGRLDLGRLPMAGNYTGLLDDPYISNLYLVYLSGSAPKVWENLPDLNLYPQLEAGVSLLASYGTSQDVHTCVYHIPSAAKKITNTRENPSDVRINKTAGPFILQKISLTYADGAAWFLVDAGIQMKGFRLMLEGLGAGYGLNDRKMHFKLNGLMMDIRSSAFTLEGSLLRKEENVYSGELLLKAGPLMMAVQGGYRKKEYTSLYAWANLRGEIGGPPCFEVNGIGVGFGYNRRLYIPDAERLEECPLIQGMAGDFRPEDMDTAFPPGEGAIWFGAGVSFRSFRMIDSIAILTAELGDDTAVNLLGRSELTVPFGLSPGNQPIARAILYLKAGYRKSEGKIAVEAALAEGSYVLSKDCVLRGQFAYYVWLNGDFVLTLGGYKNGYQKPAQYPTVTRLSLNWRLSSALNAEGSMYFALVPSGIMAGGELKLLFHLANIEAWLNAAVDIEMMWQPFAYELCLKVDIGVRVRLWICTIKVEVGCDLDIWGPDFSGIAKIHLWFISFSISFGDGAKKDDKFISVEDFRKAFLQNTQNHSLRAEYSGDYEGLAIRIENGLISGGACDIQKVSAEEFGLTVTGPVPNSTGRSFCPRTCRKKNGEPLVIKPVLEIVIEKNRENVNKDFLFSEIIGEVPAALWGGKDEKGETITAVIGKKITTAPGKANFKRYLVECEEPKPRRAELPYAHSLKPQAWENPEYSWEQQVSQIENGKCTERRRAVLNMLGFSNENISLKQTAANPKELFYGGITLATTGVK